MSAVGGTRLPLGGADFALHALGAYWRRIGGSNNATLVVECAGRLDPLRIERALAGFLAVCPWPNARMRRPFPWQIPYWQTEAVAGGHLPVRSMRATDIPAAVAAELNTPIDAQREPPVRLSVVTLPETERSALLLTWYHPLMDPRGAENLLMHLTELDDGAPAPLPATLVVPDDTRPLRVRGPLAMKGLPQLRRFRAEPPVSLGRGQPPAAPLRVRIVALKPRQQEPRPTRELSFRLAVVGRALATPFHRRERSGPPYLVPISVDRRRKGERGPVIGNFLGIHFTRFPPSPTDDPAAVARRLRQQMAEAVRNDLVEANWVGMDLMRARPLRVVWQLFGLSASSDICSFQCADTGELVIRSAGFFGCTATNGYHAPAVYPRPGLGVFLNGYREHRNLVVVWMDGVVADAEVDEIIAAVAPDLGWYA